MIKNLFGKKKKLVTTTDQQKVVGLSRDQISEGLSRIDAKLEKENVAYWADLFKRNGFNSRKDTCVINNKHANLFMQPPPKSSLIKVMGSSMLPDTSMAIFFKGHNHG